MFFFEVPVKDIWITTYLDFKHEFENISIHTRLTTIRYTFNTIIFMKVRNFFDFKSNFCLHSI